MSGYNGQNFTFFKVLGNSQLGLHVVQQSLFKEHHNQSYNNNLTQTQPSNFKGNNMQFYSNSDRELSTESRKIKIDYLKKIHERDLEIIRRIRKYLQEYKIRSLIDQQRKLAPLKATICFTGSSNIDKNNSDLLTSPKNSLPFLPGVAVQNSLKDKEPLFSTSVSAPNLLDDKVLTSSVVNVQDLPPEKSPVVPSYLLEKSTAGNEIRVDEATLLTDRRLPNIHGDNVPNLPGDDKSTLPGDGKPALPSYLLEKSFTAEKASVPTESVIDKLVDDSNDVIPRYLLEKTSLAEQATTVPTESIIDKLVDDSTDVIPSYLLETNSLAEQATTVPTESIINKLVDESTDVIPSYKLEKTSLGKKTTNVPTESIIDKLVDDSTDVERKTTASNVKHQFIKCSTSDKCDGALLSSNLQVIPNYLLEKTCVDEQANDPTGIKTTNVPTESIIDKLVEDSTDVAESTTAPIKSVIDKLEDDSTDVDGKISIRNCTKSDRCDKKLVSSKLQVVPNYLLEKSSWAELALTVVPTQSIIDILVDDSTDEDEQATVPTEPIIDKLVEDSTDNDERATVPTEFIIDKPADNLPDVAKRTTIPTDSVIDESENDSTDVAIYKLEADLTRRKSAEAKYKSVESKVSQEKISCDNNSIKKPACGSLNGNYDVKTYGKTNQIGLRVNDKADKLLVKRTRISRKKDIHTSYKYPGNHYEEKGTVKHKCSKNPQKTEYFIINSSSQEEISSEKSTPASRSREKINLKKDFNSNRFTSRKFQELKDKKQTNADKSPQENSQHDSHAKFNLAQDVLHKDSGVGTSSDKRVKADRDFKSNCDRNSKNQQHNNNESKPERSIAAYVSYGDLYTDIEVDNIPYRIFIVPYPDGNKPANSSAKTTLNSAETTNSSNRSASDSENREHGLTPEEKVNISNDVKASSSNSTRPSTDISSRAAQNLPLTINSFTTVNYYISSMTTKQSLFGEIAYQLERRIIFFVFKHRINDQNGDIRRFYGFPIREIVDMIFEESTDRSTGMQDMEIFNTLIHRYKSVLITIRMFGFKVKYHSTFTTNMINKYGRIGFPEELNLKRFKYREGDAHLWDLMSQIKTNGFEEDNMQILLNSLLVLTYDDKDPVFRW